MERLYLFAIWASDEALPTALTYERMQRFGSPLRMPQTSGPGLGSVPQVRGSPFGLQRQPLLPWGPGEVAVSFRLWGGERS